jgi:hypothetical protein
MKRIFKILILATVLACNSNEKEKPTTVPQNAIWKGGVDGGCWILFKSVTIEKLNLVIFYEDGGVWEQGIYKKVGNCDIPENEIMSSIIGFNGQELIFKQNSCSFKKTK